VGKRIKTLLNESMDGRGAEVGGMNKESVLQRAEDPTAVCRAGIPAAAGGDWMGAFELRALLLDTIGAKTGAEGNPASSAVVVDLSGLEHLDAAALQVLLAADRELHGRGTGLQFQNCSPSLERWLRYAGAEDLLKGTGNAGAAEMSRSGGV
jgi:anti-anti-sigma regulatory factor